MDPYSSGEDLVIKTRKPYTITKQRERWTEEEHNRFLEALKLYGRAWQRIEEHIGTKTAVQIRSHAQKFFTKLEKEALVKGVPIGHTLDIEIPPPRPKRKPSNPYPRKTSVGVRTSQVGLKDGKLSNPVSSTCLSNMKVELEKETEKPFDDGKLENSNEYQEKDNCTEALTLLKEACCASPSSANKTSLSVCDAPKRSCTFRQYVQLSKEARNQDETTASQVTIEAEGLRTHKSDSKELLQDGAPSNISDDVDPYLLHEKSLNNRRIDELKKQKAVDTLPTSDVQATQSYPRHVPVHILDGSLGMSGQSISPDMSYAESMFHQMGGVHSHQNLFMNPATSATPEHFSNASRSSIHQSVPSYHPIFTPIQNQDDYRSFLHMSSTFSSLIVSALSQNPAAYAAASFASTLWPCANMEAPVEPSTAQTGTFQSRPISSAPSMAAIAAATVAAATAWWAAHGLLPLCAPFHPGFTCSPASASATPMASSQGKAVNSERRENSPDPALRGQQLEPECSEALHEQHSRAKSPTLSTSDSEATEGAKLNLGLAADETEKIADAAELHDAKSKNKKQVDRSSCGSNTPSSSEVEADALEKHTKGKEEKLMKDKEDSQGLGVVHPVGDPFSRRFRSTSNMNDSWKHMQGRLAFQALFSREVLPQSFSPPHGVKIKGKKISIKDKENPEEKVENGLQLDLNGKTWATFSEKQGVQENALLTGENKEDGLLNLGLGHAKLKAHRTGFKPYKRCSVEAKESRVSANSQDDEKGPKRLRLEGETST
ncbi:protein LHY-like [Sesamum indicum]|uniref:Protein LHY-like n=1 Tax=Sesamum indicum TaxID=4182 RepID=A0A8M8V2Y3_SESIN|nr:protein LHY-like [Sesamum indicum]